MEKLGQTRGQVLSRGGILSPLINSTKVSVDGGRSTSSRGEHGHRRAAQYSLLYLKVDVGYVLGGLWSINRTGTGIDDERKDRINAGAPSEQSGRADCGDENCDLR